MTRQETKSTPPETTSYWMKSRPPDLDSILTAPLSKNENADVCIIGAGIAGMTTAYLLAKEGRSVIVLEACNIGSGQTERTTAHLASAMDDRFENLEKWHGEEGAKLAYESHRFAIDQIEKIVREEKIDCDFTRLPGYLFNPPAESFELLERELIAAQKAGFREAALVPSAGIDGFETGPCIRFPRQAQFQPLRYLSGLVNGLLKHGGRIFAHTAVKKVRGGTKASIETQEGYSVHAHSVVVATNTPINDTFVIHTKQAPYRTYVVSAYIPRGSVPMALYWDTLDPYHYVRIEHIDAIDDLLIIGGEDHKTGQDEHPENHHLKLEAWAQARFPMIKKFADRWSGQVMEPFDGLAFIGRNPLDADNVFIVTGDSGQGMTHGTITGILLTDLIQGRDNPWKKLYEPSRKTLRAAAEFAKENLNVAEQFVDWVTGSEAASLKKVACGSGAVFQNGLHKIAIYRDAHGAFHERSAVCRHLGCIVHWNSVENSWDCPCHGSRYDAFGKVIEGPAVEDLKEVDVHSSLLESTH